MEVDVTDVPDFLDRQSSSVPAEGIPLFTSMDVASRMQLFRGLDCRLMKFGFGACLACVKCNHNLRVCRLEPQPCSFCP